jgi:hypothetical protein
MTLVGTGSLGGVDPDRIILKKVSAMFPLRKLIVFLLSFWISKRNSLPLALSLCPALSLLTGHSHGTPHQSEEEICSREAYVL